MSKRSKNGFKYLLNVSILISFWLLFKIIYSFNHADQGKELALAFITAIGLILFIGVPSFIIGWFLSRDDNE